MKNSLFGFPCEKQQFWPTKEFQCFDMKMYFTYGSFDVTLAEIESRKHTFHQSCKNIIYNGKESIFLILKLMRLWGVLFFTSKYGETFIHLSRFYREGKEEFYDNVLSQIRKYILTPLQEKNKYKKDALEKLQEKQLKN